jgi:hypothetical protein
MTANDDTDTLSGSVPLSALRVTRAEDGRYRAAWAGHVCIVRVCTCFPWTAPGTFVSLRDENDKEVALIPSLDEVDAESRAVLGRALREAAFAFEITHVAVMRKEFEIRQWEVTCAEGPRTFQTKIDDYPHPLPPRGLLITDVVGDVYVIHDWTTLDKHSRKQISLFID